MRPIRLVTLAVALSIVTACATRAPAGAAETPPLLAALPERVESFEYEGFKRFEDGSEGFSVRYANARKHRLADVYVYPVADENLELAHEALVLGSTRATMEAIGEAVRRGVYTDLDVLDAATRSRGPRTIARVQATYLRQNLASYTLLYQTEHDGTLMKIRLSMPDNASNRANGEWDRFAERLFDLIIAEQDGAAV